MAANLGSLANSVARSSGTPGPTTMLQLVAPTNQALRVKSFGIGFRGTSVTQEPLLVKISRQTTAGTMTALTPLKKSLGGPTIQSTGQELATVEPTTTDILFTISLHPQGTFEKNFRPDDEILIDGAGRIGLIVESANAIDLLAHIDFEE